MQRFDSSFGPCGEQLDSEGRQTVQRKRRVAGHQTNHRDKLLFGPLRLFEAEELRGVAVPDQVLLLLAQTQVGEDRLEALDVLVDLVRGAVRAEDQLSTGNSCRSGRVPPRGEQYVTSRTGT